MTATHVRILFQGTSVSVPEIAHPAQKEHTWAFHQLEQVLTYPLWGLSVAAPNKAPRILIRGEGSFSPTSSTRGPFLVIPLKQILVDGGAIDYQKVWVEECCLFSLCIGTLEGR